MTTIMLPKVHTLNRFELERVDSTRVNSKELEVATCDRGVHAVERDYSSERTETFRMSLLHRLSRYAVGTPIHHFIFELFQSKRDHERRSETTIDAHVTGALAGVVIGRRLETRSSYEETSTTRSIAFPEDDVRKWLAPTTKEIVGRFEEAEKRGDQPMIDAYRMLVRILTTQKKKAWAEALYLDVKAFLTNGPNNPYQKVLAKLSPDQLEQFLSDARATLRSTKGFEHEAELLAEHQVGRRGADPVLDSVAAAVSVDGLSPDSNRVLAAQLV